MEKPIWKRNITAFFISQAISMFGSSIVQFAIVWYVAKETQSGIMVTLMASCSFLPQVVISLFAGVWADRHNRKMLIILADASIAAATLILAFIIMSGVNFMWALLVISALRSIGSGVQTPAVNALIPQIVPEEKLMRVSGINGSLMSMINLVAPAVSGAILSCSKIQYIMFIDIITAIIGIGIFLFIPIKSHSKAAEKQKGGYFTDLKEGLRYSFTHKFIKQTLCIYIIFTVLIVPAAFLNVLFVTRVFGDSYWNLTLNEMFFFVGAMLGGFVLSAWGGFKNRIATLVLGSLIFGACTVAIGLIKVFWIYLIIMIITGISMPLCNSPIMVLMQEKVDLNMQGRVFSLLQIAFSLFMPIGMAIFGPLADKVPIQWLMIVSGASLILLTTITRFYKSYYNEGIRSLPEPAEMKNE